MHGKPSADRLAEFREVVIRGSIAAAGRALGVRRATLSRRMSELERDLGVRLMQRTTRRLTLTPAGEELFTRACRVVEDTAAAWAAVQRHDGRPRGPLRVAMPDTEMAGDPFFAQFALDYPEVALDVAGVGQGVDLRAAGFDVALVFGPVADDTLIRRRLGRSPQVVLGAPNYLAAHGTPRTLDDLASHRAVLWRDDFGRPMRQWPLLDGGRIEMAPALITDSFRLLVDATRQGVGLGLLPLVGLHNEIDDGALVPVLRDEVGRLEDFSIVFVERDFMLPQVRVFIDRASAYWSDWLTRWDSSIL